MMGVRFDKRNGMEPSTCPIFQLASAHSCEQAREEPTGLTRVRSTVPLQELRAIYDARAMNRVWNGPRCRIHYSLLGSGPPLYLAMGMAANRALYGPLAATLSDHFRVIVPEQPGMVRGDGANVARYTMADHTADMLGLIDELGIESVHLLGHSFGAQRVLHAAAQCPARISSVILVSGFTRRPLNTFEQIVLTVARHFPGRMGWVPGMRTAVRFNHDIDLANREPGVIPFYLSQLSQLPIGTVAAQLALVASFDVTEYAKQIRLPVMMIHGQDDRLVHPRIAAELEKEISNVRLMLIPECGHLPHLSHPELLAHAAHWFRNNIAKPLFEHAPPVKDQ